MTNLVAIDTLALDTITGGNGTQTPSSTPAPPTRSWGQVAADYGTACVTNATTAAIFQGRPQSWQQMAVTAGIGCAMGVATQAAQDWQRSQNAK